jgi:hypothetical protein
MWFQAQKQACRKDDQGPQMYLFAAAHEAEAWRALQELEGEYLVEFVLI